MEGADRRRSAEDIAANGFVGPQSHSCFRLHVIDICRFDNGKLVEHWGVPDRFALLHQIQALEPPPKQ
jgi:predicted ester cyclase